MAFGIVCSTDALELAVYGRYQDQAIVNVFALRVFRGSSPDSIGAGSTIVMERFRLWYRTFPVQGLSNGYAVDSYVLRKYDMSFPRPVQHRWRYSVAEVLAGTGDDTGAGGAASLSTQATANVTLRTGIVGRSFRGRKSISPIPEDNTVNTAGGGNKLTDTAMAGYNLDYSTLLAGLDMLVGADPYTIYLHIGSLKRYKQDLPVGETFTLVTSAVCQRHTGSLVSRKARNSPH